MRKFKSIFSWMGVILSGLQASASNDLCSEATPLCANIGLITTNVGATAAAGETLSCGDMTVNNSLWFTMSSIAAGPVNITVYNINNPGGLEMEIFTGTCGSLVSTGRCATGSPSTAGRMSIAFTTVPGTVYYIMVDGGNGNSEAFGIIANTSMANIVGRPNANFNTSPSFGCAPLSVTLENTTVLQGGTNISYDWQIDNGSYLPASGSDTTVVLTAPGMHTLALRVCNSECGCKIVSQDVQVQQLVGGFTYSSAGNCAGNAFDFQGLATVQPNPPFSDPGVTDWQWNFGDPSAGLDSIASGQQVSHTFSGSQSAYAVTLTILGACSTTTITQQLQIDQLPLVAAPASTSLCLGNTVPLTVNASGSHPPFSYSWSGPSAIACDTCPITTAAGPIAAGNYLYTITVTDSHGCSTTDTTMADIHPLPEASVTPEFLVCRGDSVRLTSSVATGNPPFSYAWSPASGLNDPSSSSPGLAAWTAETYCLILTDSFGCSSAPACTDILLQPSPAISPANPFVCVTEPNPQNTFSVTGAGAGSTYSWATSPDYSLITGANADSSAVTASFPSGVAAAYDFTVTVIDGITGCRDTVRTVCNAINNVNLSVSGPSDACEGDIVTWDVSGATSFAWTASPAYPFTDSTASSQTISAETGRVFTITGTAGSCSQTITRTLTVHQKPAVVIAPIPDFCNCDTLELDASTSIANGILFWNGSVPVLDPTIASTSAYTCSDASFTLSITDPTTGCSSTDSITATAHSSPAAAASVTPEEICAGISRNVLLNGTGSNTDSGTVYSWTSSRPAVSIINPTSLLGSALVSDITVFQLTVTDRFGCDSTASDTVTNYPLPTLTASSSFICSSDTVTETSVTVYGAAEGSYFSWSASAPCLFQTGSADSSATFELGSCGPGSYDIHVTVIDAITGCHSDLSTVIEVIDSVSIAVTSDTSVCEGESLLLAASGANSYVWSTGDTTNSVYVSGLTAANSPYSFTVTGTAGLCSNRRTVTVIALPLPTPVTLQGPDTVCQNSTASLYFVTPSGGNHTWEITGGTLVSGQGTDSILVDWGISGAGSIHVTDTTANGCSGNTVVRDVTIAPRPVPATNINGPYRVCAGSTLTYLVLPMAGSEYTWSVTGGTVAGSLTADSIVVSWPDTGSGQVTVYETNAAGCSGPVTLLPISIHEIPSAPILHGNLQLCQGSVELYTTGPANGSTFNWQTNGGMISGYNTAYDSISVSWTIPGNHVLSVTETNRWGCTGPVTADTVTIYQQPEVAIAYDSVFACQNTPLTVTATSAFGTISWNSSGSGIFDNPTILSPGYTPGAGDTSGFVLTAVASSFGCPNDTDEVFIVLHPLPIVTVTASATTVCEGTADTLTATGGGSYRWIPSNDSGATILVTPSATTTYTVVVTNTAGCSATGTTTVFVNPAGIAEAGADQVVCEGDTVTLSGSQTNASGLSWSTTGDGSFLPDSLTAVTGYLPGPADLTNGSAVFYLTTTGACRNGQDSTVVTFGSRPSVYAGPDTSIVTLEVTGVQVPLQPGIAGGSSVVWSSSGTGTFVPDNTTPSATYVPSREDFSSDSVVLILTVVGGCMNAVDSLIVEFVPFIIPNVITPFPGSPGMNDYFEIRNLPDRSSLTIWDRWGIAVFESEDYRNNWDAANLHSDTYYYILKARGRDFRGWLRVIREDR